MKRNQRNIFDPSESLGALWARLNHPKRWGEAAPTTVEALMYSLRQRGAAALFEPDCQRRVSELSREQVKEVIERLDRLRPKYSAITDGLLLNIAELIS